MEPNKNKRLLSLDILRGADLFFLLALGPIIETLFRGAGSPSCFQGGIDQLSHVSWEGLTAWDMIMPLFMFMAGVSMPFAFSKYKNENNRPDYKVYLRILRRFVGLWILGMIVQGNLLDLNPQNIRLYSNTLQAIAIGYLFSSLIYLNFKTKTQIAITLSLLIGYWAIMKFACVDGFGAGDYSQSNNFAEYIDRLVLGRFRDGVSFLENGSWQFSKSYYYTWVISSLTFVVTVMSGVFAGSILKNRSFPDILKIKWLIAVASILIVAGLLWSIETPVIKTIWTPSMTLITSGISTALMLLFFYIIDYKGVTKGLLWLDVYGKNSIAAYTISHVINFSSISKSLFYGLEQYTGSFYSLLIVTSNVIIVYLIIWYMNKRGVYLKV